MNSTNQLNISNKSIGQVCSESSSELLLLAKQLERSEILNMLEVFSENLIKTGNHQGSYVIQLAIKMINDLRK